MGKLGIVVSRQKPRSPTITQPGASNRAALGRPVGSGDGDCDGSSDSTVGTWVGPEVGVGLRRGEGKALGRALGWAVTVGRGEGRCVGVGVGRDCVGTDDGCGVPVGVGVEGKGLGPQLVLPSDGSNVGIPKVGNSTRPLAPLGAARKRTSLKPTTWCCGDASTAVEFREHSVGP